MQFMKTMRVLLDIGVVARIEFTSAVLPVPGDPEIYNTGWAM
jgi:hypothetical protein